MKSFKSIREGNSVEPGVSEINDVPEDPLSFVEIKPKKTKVVKEDLQEAVSVKKEKHSWGTMMTVHHGSDTSYPLHPEHQSAIKKLRPGMKTTFKDETNSTVHAHREGDTVHLTRPKSGSTLTSLPYHHFDTSEHAKPAFKKPAGEYDRKVTDHLKKKYNEENMVETKGAPKGFHFTKDGKLKRGDANQDGDGGAMLRADPLDKQRSKVPAVSERVEQMDEKLTSKDIKMAVGVAKDKRYAGGNMSGAVKTMEKMKPGLSKHPRVQQVLKSTQEGIEEEYEDSGEEHPMMYKHVSSVNSNTWSGTAKHHGKNLPKVVHDLEKERDSIKKKGGSKNATSNHDHAIMQLKQHLPSTNEGIDFLKIWNGIKPVHEEIKTTHEDPLVVTRDEEGNIHTHANLSVANAIHGTNVKHQAIHTNKKVQDGKFTFELSKHHAGALKEDAPFDPVAHKKELDKLMGKHMAAHTETTKLISAKAPQEAINKAQERNNAIKAEIRAHKDKVPKAPAKKDGGPGAYYASKKPGEYTGD
jgi:hypothetical protein